MIKKLTKHGNSSALVIERPIMELLKIDNETPLEITTDGKRLIIQVATAKLTPKEIRGGRVEKSHRKITKVFKKLAK